MWKSRKFRSQSLCQTQNHRTSMKNDQVQYESAQKSHQLAWKMSKSSMYQLKIISTSMKNCKVDDVPAIFHDDPSKSQIWVHDRWPHQNSCPSAWWTHFWSMDQLIWCRFHDESVFNIADQHSTAINLMRSTRFEFRTMSWWWVGWWSSMWVDEIEVKFQFDANFYFQVGMKFIKICDLCILIFIFNSELHWVMNFRWKSTPLMLMIDEVENSSMNFAIFIIKSLRFQGKSSIWWWNWSTLIKFECFSCLSHQFTRLHRWWELIQHTFDEYIMCIRWSHHELSSKLMFTSLSNEICWGISGTFSYFEVNFKSVMLLHLLLLTFMIKASWCEHEHHFCSHSSLCTRLSWSDPQMSNSDFHDFH